VFALATDEGEEHELSGTEPGRASELEEALLAWEQEVRDER